MSEIRTVDRAISLAVEETFMNMAFIDVISSQRQALPDGVSQLIVIDITKPARGTMLMRLPLTLKQQIVENIHGGEWDNLNAREIDDCLLEVLNVLAGRYLYNLNGDNVKYNMTFPQIVFDESEFETVDDFTSYSFDAEGLMFEISIRMENHS